MILAGMPPSEVMKITSGCSPTAVVTYGDRSASALLDLIVLSRLMLYLLTVGSTILPPSLEDLSSCATRSTPGLGGASFAEDWMLSWIAGASPRLSRDT